MLTTILLAVLSQRPVADLCADEPTESRARCEANLEKATAAISGAMNEEHHHASSVRAPPEDESESDGQRSYRYSHSIPEWMKDGELITRAAVVQYCRTKPAIKEEQAIIAKQKRIAKLGGFMDKKVIYDAAKQIVELQDRESMLVKKFAIAKYTRRDLEDFCTSKRVRLVLRCGPKSGVDYSEIPDDKECDTDQIHAILMLAENALFAEDTRTGKIEAEE